MTETVESAHTHDAPSAQVEPEESLDLGELINKFGKEIGVVRGQAIVDQHMAESRYKALSDKHATVLAERDELANMLAELQQRIEALENPSAVDGNSSSGKGSKSPKPS